MRLASLLVLVLSALLSNLPARADTYPSRFIRMIVPYPAGGTSDVLARVLAKKMGDSMGQQIVIENIGGAAGTIGAGSVARAEPDGYTLIFGYTTQFTIAPVLYQNLTYDPLRSFVPIGSVVRFHFLMTAYSDLPVNSLADVVSYAKANPGKLTFASPGVGTVDAPAWRSVQTRSRDRYRARPLQGRRPGDHRLCRRPHRSLLRRHRAAAALGAAGQDQAAGRHLRRAAAGVAERPHRPSKPACRISLCLFGPPCSRLPAHRNPSPTGWKANCRRRWPTPRCRRLSAAMATRCFPGSPAAVTELIKADLARWSALAKATGLKVE